MMAAAAHDESLLRLSLQHFEATGEYRDPTHFQQQLGPPADAVRPGCFVALLGHLFRPRAAAPPGTAAAAKPNKATEKLDAASAAIEARAVGLAEKAGTLRATAKTLHASGEKKQALQMLRRAKAAEKQAETAQATQMSLEQQRDLLESAVLQKSVSDALSQAVKKSRRSTRGLLSKAETAVEESAELNDLHADIQSVVGELGNQGADVYDEDELALELAQMCAEDAPAVAATPATPAAPVAAPKRTAAAVASPDSVLVSEEALWRYPKVPTQAHAVLGVSAEGV